MKIRVDFVTNSSSTSYVVLKIIVDRDFYNGGLKEKIEKLLDAENIDYDIVLKCQMVDNVTGELGGEWDIDEE